MKTLARIALRLLGAVSTVFIAACYGVRTPATAPPGTVVDATSRVRLPGILVTCLGDGGATLDQDVTDPQGEFPTRPGCATYRAEDVDGATNGTYATATAAFADGEPVVIELTPVP